MKRVLFIIIAFFLSCSSYSQIEVKNPKTGIGTAPYLKLEKLELRDTATVLSFHINFTPGNWISIPKQTYIQPVGSDEKLFIISAEGIPLNEKYFVPESGEVSYTLYFRRLNPSVSKFDYGEANEGGTWFIYDIQVKPDHYKSMLPEKISGNWFRSDDGQWKISLLDSVVVYKSKVWKYRQYAEKNGLGKIGLKNAKETLDIYIKPITDSTCLIGETPDGLNQFVLHPNESAIPADNEPFKAPVFKSDTVTYCGYVKGFSRRYPNRTGMIYVNNILTGEQDSYLLKIADDGSFEVKFPHINPQGVFVKMPFSFETIFFEPGKTTFQLFDRNNQASPYLFMGDCARINTELQKLKNINSTNYSQLQEKVLDLSPEQYKDLCMAWKQKDLDALAQYSKEHPLGAKARQLKEMEIKYRSAEAILDYNMLAQSAYRKKNNVPMTQHEIDYTPEQPNSSYYSFLTSDFVNNPLAVLSADYSSFINRLMFFSFLQTKMKGFTIPEIMTELGKTGNKITDRELELGVGIEANDTPEGKKIETEFQENYGKASKDFHQKYAAQLQEFNQKMKDSVITFSKSVKYLTDKNVVFTEAEEAYIQAQEKYNNNPIVLKRKAFYTKYSKDISQFYNDHRTFVTELYRDSRIAQRDKLFREELGIQPGLANDIMVSQEICRPIVSEMTPSPEAKIKAVQKEITTLFIASYIGLKNEETKAKIEANKKQAEPKVNEVPKTENENIFDAIMKKYRGKVVYVDFWATWCAPCRSGIEQIKPLKEELANKNIVFVYITNQTSPKTTYENMIPNVKGEHYRVSDDEWNILSSRFNITGIPHTMLVGKDGIIINPHLAFMDNTQLKTLLTKYIED